MQYANKSRREQHLNVVDLRPLSSKRSDAENPTQDRSQADLRSALPATAKQVQVLAAIEQFIDARGWPPSLSELCCMLHTSSKAALVDHLSALVRKGYLRRDPGERRGLKVLVSSKNAVVSEPKPLRKAVHCDRCKREIA